MGLDPSAGDAGTGRDLTLHHGRRLAMSQPIASAAPYTDPAAIFAGTATDYALYRVLHPPQVAVYITHLARQHAPAPRMADLGCGPGTLTLELAARGVDMIAVDPNADMLAAGRSQASARGLLGIDWRTGTAEQIAAQPGVRGLTAPSSPVPTTSATP